MDAGAPRSERLALAARHRGLRRRVSRDPPVSGWERAAVPRADDTAAAACGLRLRALQFSRERHRAEQGRLLPRAAENAGHDPDGDARLAAVVALLSEIAATAKSAAREEDRARAPDPRRSAG